MATITSPTTGAARRFAVIGAGIAGLACARTLAQAGCEVTVIEKATKPGGRMASRETPFGSFDHGALYFTVRDERFCLALRQSADGLVRLRLTAHQVAMVELMVGEVMRGLVLASGR